MHWLPILKDEKDKTINFYRLSSKYKKVETILKKVIRFYKEHKYCSWIFEDIEKTARIDIYFTTYETNDEQKRLTIDKAQIMELINAA